MVVGCIGRWGRASFELEVGFEPFQRSTVRMVSIGSLVSGVQCKVPKVLLRQFKCEEID